MYRVEIKRDGRVEGDYSLYLDDTLSAQGPCYMGVTFRNVKRAQKVQRFIEKNLEEESRLAPRPACPWG